MGLDAGHIVDFVSLLLLGLIFLSLDLTAIVRGRGGHRVVALLLAVGIAWVMAGVILDPGAHPLWTVDIIVWLIPAICILLILRLFKANRRRR
jgi:peptidoglycan/LPS O-acetylase OafA/YrhL